MFNFSPMIVRLLYIIALEALALGMAIIGEIYWWAMPTLPRLSTISYSITAQIKVLYWQCLI